MHGREHRGTERFAVGQGEVDVVHHEAPGGAQEDAGHERRAHQRDGDVPHRLARRAAVDERRLLEAGIHAHEAGDVDQHHVPRVLPDRHEDQAEDRALGRRQQRRHRGAGDAGGDRDEGTVEDELPHVAQNDAADQVWDEEAGAEEVLAFDAAGHQEREQECHDVGDDDGDHRIDDRHPQRRPEIGIGDDRGVVVQPDERLVQGHAVPAGEGKVQAVEERHDDDQAEQQCRGTREHQELPGLVAKLSFRHSKPFDSYARGQGAARRCAVPFRYAAGAGNAPAHQCFTRWQRCRPRNHPWSQHRRRRRWSPRCR